ncbi:MAG: hypothetical protein R3E91_02925 [Chlamydiales bacterium]
MIPGKFYDLQMKKEVILPPYCENLCFIDTCFKNGKNEDRKFRMHCFIDKKEKDQFLANGGWS